MQVPKISNNYNVFFNANPIQKASNKVALQLAEEISNSKTKNILNKTEQSLENSLRKTSHNLIGDIGVDDFSYLEFRKGIDESMKDLSMSRSNDVFIFC